MAGAHDTRDRPSRGAVVGVAALAIALLLGPAEAVAVTFQTDVVLGPVRPQPTGCGLLVDVDAELVTARLIVVLLPDLDPVPLPDDGLLSQRGEVEVELLLPAPDDPTAPALEPQVRVTLDTDGEIQPYVDLALQGCAPPAEPTPTVEPIPTVEPTPTFELLRPTPLLESPAPAAQPTVTGQPTMPAPATTPPPGPSAPSGEARLSLGWWTVTTLVPERSVPPPDIAPPPATSPTPSETSLNLLPAGGSSRDNSDPTARPDRPAALPQWADLVPAAAVLSASLGGLVALARRRLI